jgi:glycosyltransferase involved in cell wall biosynthesis
MHFPYFSLPIFYNRPFVVTIHDLILNHFPTGKASTLPYPLYWIKWLGYEIVLRHAVMNSKKIIVPLHVVEQDLIKTLHIPKGKIVVTYEGSSKLKPQKVKRELNTKKYFLYVGNAYPHKNLTFLIEEFVSFQKDGHDDITLLLVGKDDYFYQRLREKVKKDKIIGVIFRHNVSDEELFFLYQHALAFVSASKMEGFGLPPLEAMSASCPLLLSDIAAFHEVCGNIALYFEPLRKLSLARKMQFMYNLTQPEKQKFLNKGLALVTKFSWEKMAKETVAVYESSISL